MKNLVARATANINRLQYQTIATSGSHAIVVDEPEHFNGGDTGMNPFGLLLSSLGSCTVITLRMYIERKMWVVDEISIELDAFAVAEGHLIESKITFKGELTAEQNERLLQIADACPIHKLIAGNVVIDTKIAV